MRKIIVAFCFISLIILGGCKNEGTDKVDKTYQIYFDSVMLIHDRAMKMMGPINQLSEQLKDRRQKVIDQNEAEFLKVNSLLGNLNKAENAMFEWMNQFDSNPNHEDKMRYIQLQLYRIKQIEMLMAGTIGEVKDHLGTE